jgi:hypothetical protein
VETERDAMLSPSDEGTSAPGAMLKNLKGIGPEFAGFPWSEGLFRSFCNRRQVAAYAGLAPTPRRSGSVAHEQGVSKAGNPRLQTTMIQLAWLWIKGDSIAWQCTHLLPSTRPPPLFAGHFPNDLGAKKQDLNFRPSRRYLRQQNGDPTAIEYLTFKRACQG